MHKNTSTSSKKHNVEPPKKPATSFLRYSVENREIVKKKHPELGGKEVLKQVSNDWNGMSEKEKKKYVDAYEKEHVKYLAELKAYEDKYGPVAKKSKKEKESGKASGKGEKTEKRGRKTTKESNKK